MGYSARRFRITAVTAAVCVAALAAHAQTISKIAPAPSQWGVWGACFLDGQKGFACGEMKGLYRTLDGGETWSQVPLPGVQDSPLYSVRFFDANIGIVIGNSAAGSQDIFRTTNGGATWSPVVGFPLGGSWYHQDTISPITGFIGSNGAIVRTTNAGASWQLRSAYPTCPSITGMAFLDANVGFATGGLPTFQTGLFRTTDGAATWTLVIPGSGDDVIALSPSVLLTNIDNTIMRSDNGGADWSATGASVPTGMTDLERVDASTAVGVSGKGDIWRTTDGGYSWAQVWTGEGDLPGNWSARFTTASFGVVCGVRGLMYATHDGGATWARMNRGAAFDGNGLTALSNDTIVTVGHHGYAQTVDVAQGWALSLVDPPEFLRDTSYSAVDSVGAGLVYAVGHWGGAARSTDGGVTWQNLNGVVSMDFYANDVEFTDAQNGWMTGWDYTPGQSNETYRTSDGGLSWQVVTGGNHPGVAIEVVGERVWIQSGARANWRSADGGATFIAGELPMNAGSSPSVMDISFTDALVGYACGYDGYLVRTLNGGASWTQVGSATINTHNLSVLTRGDELWVCGARAGGGNAFIKRSLDRGATWQVWSFGGQYTTPYRMARTATRLYASGYNGEVWMIDGLAGCDGIDFNRDGLFPDTMDIQDFLTVFEGGACPTGGCGDIDFNNDGLFPDTLDIDSLLTVFSGGPCV